MLISHEYRFIFIKNRKVAGTSIEISLSRFLRHPDDVITPMNPEDEALRCSETGVKPRNYRKRLRDLRVGDAAGFARRRARPERFWNHCGADHVRAEVGDELFASYFKFCFERNPWDKVVSWYWFRDDTQKTRPYGDFRTMIERDVKSLVDWNLYADERSPIVDFVGRFDRLVPDLTQVCDRLKLPFDGWLPRAKGGFRTDKQPYRAYHDARTRDLVAGAFSREIETFGYRFEPEPGGT